MKAQVKDYLDTPDIDSVSVYFRDLNSSLWAGVDENTGYDPASLMKVPIMIAWLKKIDADRSVLGKKLVWKGSPYDDKGVAFYGLHPGQAYTVDTKISPAMYARFLRILYNSTYLSRDLSEKALELLSSTDFRSGLVGGIPSDINVAHKFGQYSDGTSTDPIELHDCGIIYFPKNPYLLCIMTRGTTDLSVLETVIKKISSSVYGLVSNYQAQVSSTTKM